jgi:outer membrane protein assembly factor BamB
VASGKFILVCTNRSTLEIIDCGLGTSKAMSFPDNVSELDAAPFVFRDKAYLVIDGHIVAIDINTRLQVWTYPPEKNIDLSQLSASSLWVQEHELIQNNAQVFAGSKTGTLTALGVDGTTITPYPNSSLEFGITGAAMVDHFDSTHSTLYVPTASALTAFDVTTVTERSALKRIYSVQTRGELIGRPVRAVVAGKPAILATDNTGIVMAVDANPSATDTARVIGSWPLEGTTVQQPAHHLGKPVAYVSVAEGRELALDLEHPGQLLWRYPAQGTLGPLRGAPVIGNRGLYVADANGILHCIDPDSGSERWRVDVGSPVNLGILAHDGSVYIATKGGSVLCFAEGEQ